MLLINLYFEPSSSVHLIVLTVLVLYFFIHGSVTNYVFSLAPPSSSELTYPVFLRFCFLLYDSLRRRCSLTLPSFVLPSAMSIVVIVCYERPAFPHASISSLRRFLSLPTCLH